MNQEAKELFIARMKGLMDDTAIDSEMRRNKSLVIHYAQKENWVKVAELTEELILLREEKILRLESRMSINQEVSNEQYGGSGNVSTNEGKGESTQSGI